MGRENQDPTIVHSSIALLQERFRQLQRVKEMREERELQKMLTEPKQFNSNNTTPTLESTRLFSHPELIIPSSRSPPHVSLSLWPTTSQGKQEEEYTSFQTPVSMNSSGPTNYIHTHAHTQSLQASWKKGYEYDCDSSGSDSGVDTSLHL